MTRNSFIPALCASLLSLGTAPLQAETDNDWQFAVKAYLWAADIGGNTGAGDSVDVSFSGPAVGAVFSLVKDDTTPRLCLSGH